MVRSITTLIERKAEGTTGWNGNQISREMTGRLWESKNNRAICPPKRKWISTKQPRSPPHCPGIDAT